MAAKAGTSVKSVGKSVKSTAQKTAKAGKSTTAKAVASPGVSTKIALKGRSSKKSKSILSKVGQSVKSVTSNKSAAAGASTSVLSKVTSGLGLTSKSAPSAGRVKSMVFRGKKRSTKTVLKKAYDKRAIRKIRMGNLGGARKDLMKKATVV